MLPVLQRICCTHGGVTNLQCCSHEVHIPDACAVFLHLRLCSEHTHFWRTMPAAAADTFVSAGWSDGCAATLHSHGCCPQNAHLREHPVHEQFSQPVGLPNTHSLQYGPSLPFSSAVHHCPVCLPHWHLLPSASGAHASHSQSSWCSG